MKCWEAALRAAVASGEAELLYEAVLHIRTRLVASSGGGGEEDGKVR